VLKNNRNNSFVFIWIRNSLKYKMRNILCVPLKNKIATIMLFCQNTADGNAHKAITWRTTQMYPYRAQSVFPNKNELATAWMDYTLPLNDR
jgi:hypothetical protein